MGLVRAGLFLLLCFSAHIGAGYGLRVQDPESEWERMAKVVGEEMTQTPVPRSAFWKDGSTDGSSLYKAKTPAYKKVPEFRIVKGSSDMTKLFKPEQGARKLPEKVREMLLVTAAPKVASKPKHGSGKVELKQSIERKQGSGSQPAPVEMLCHVDRLYVRVLRRLFQYRDDFKYLKLGNCLVNQATKDHYYLLYLLKTDCGFESKSLPDAWSVTIRLHYKRPERKCIIRTVEFHIPLNCVYHRFFHSYKVGFLPKLQGGTLFKALTPKTGYVLSSHDASGNQITGAKTYLLGQPMYFSASRPDAGNAAKDKRMYIHKCFMTASKNPNSSPKFTVIDNHGCMVDSKLSPNSKFYTGKSKLVQRFMVGAFVFRNKLSSSSKSQQLYLHCEMSLGPLTPTRSSKACNFDPIAKKWKELYGPDSVCICCETPSSCSSSQPRATTSMVSSQSWKVDLSDKDEPDESVPQMKSSNIDMISLEEPDVTVPQDFLNYWDENEDY